MPSILNLAVIGTNWITGSFVQSAHESKLFKLVAVYSRSLATAHQFLADTPSLTDASAITSYTGLSELLADPAVDVVYIASPNSLHHQQGLQALAAGKHVIMEKPLASNLREADELFQLADAKNLLLLEAYRHIQEPNFRALQRLLHDPARRAQQLGQIYGASVNMAVYSSRYAKVLAGEEPNVLSLAFSGGSLWDMGCYPVAFALALFGKPASQAYHPVIVRTGVDGGGHMLLHYAAGSSSSSSSRVGADDAFTVHAHTSKIYTSAAPTEIYCEKGTLRIRGATGVSDIDSVEFFPRGAKEGVQLADTTPPEYTGLLNLTWEAKELGRILLERDGQAEAVLRALSRDVLEVMEHMRRSNGIVFASER